MGSKRTAFATKNLVGYVTNKEIERPGFEYAGFFGGNHVYQKIKTEEND